MSGMSMAMCCTVPVWVSVSQGVVTTMDHVVTPATAVKNFDRPKLALDHTQI